MSKSASNQTNFRDLRAQFSERFRANGDFAGFAGDPTLYAPLMQQVQFSTVRIQDLAQKPDRTPEETRELENHRRLNGDWRKQLRESAQLAFEKMFMVVAQARIPKEHFLVLAKEARELWRGEGWNQFVPVYDKKVRKMKRRREANAQ